MNDQLSRKITLCFALACSGLTLHAQEAYRPEVGKLHPDITLPSIETRESVSLTAYRGKKVLLIHFASW